MRPYDKLSREFIVTMQQNLLEQHLSKEELLALKNKRSGMTVFQISWIMAFFCLIIVNWQLRYSYTQWPPPGVEKMGLALPTLATAALLASVFLARRGLKAVRQDKRETFLTLWGTVLVLGALFVVIMAYEWLIVPLGTQYGTVFRLMTGFHGFHALVIGIYMMTIYQNARKGQYGQFDFWAVEAAVKLWYFVAFAWIMFYAVLYWI